MDIKALLVEAINRGASDLHLSSGVPPTLRVNGELQHLEYPPLSKEDCTRMTLGILTDEQRQKFEMNWELDFSLEVEGIGRFRGNVHKEKGTYELAVRVVSDIIRSIEELGLPEIVSELARKTKGLIVVTGPTGSGKTTTLASMVDQINNERRCMVITVEDPIEYLHRHRKCVVKQREVGSDTRSFPEALRHVLRQDPDVIVIGEMRDLETIQTSLTAAETGHLVITTLHTPDAVSTIDRIIDVFSPYQQQQVRIQLANTLEGIVAQQLIGMPNAQGRVVACEILLATIAVRKIVRSAKTEQLTTLIQTSLDQGMTTMDKSLKTLYQRGLVTYEDAISRCKYPENFEKI